MDIKKEFGKKIKIMRKKRNLTQEQLAEIINITPRNMSGIEIGENFVKAETLEKLLVALDTTTEELFANDYLKSSDILLQQIQKDINLIKENKNKLRAIYKFISCIKNL